MDIGQAAQELADMLTGAGVPAVVDPRDLDLPAAWIVPGPIEYPVLDETASMDWSIYLIAPSAWSTPQALSRLGAMLAAARGPLQCGDATPVTITLPNQAADALPALLVQITTTIS